MNRRRESPLAVISFAANFLIAGLVIAALYLAQDVFIPLTLATLLAFLLGPLADRLESWGLGRIPAVLVIALVAFSLLGGIVGIVGREATKLASNMPQYQTEIVKKIEGFSSMGAGTAARFSRLMNAVSQAVQGKKHAAPGEAEKPVAPIEDLDAQSTQIVVKEEAAPPGSADNPLYTVPAPTRQSSVETVLGAVTALLSPLTTFGLVVVFTIFMLVAREDLRDRLIRVLSGGRYIVTTKAIDEASYRISSYIIAQTILNSLYGLAIGIGLWVIGLTLGGDKGFPNFALWGLLCTVLRFVSYLGPIVAGSFPVLLSLIVFPGFSVFLATAVLFLGVELMSNNVIEPWLYGTRTGISPMAVIIAAVFWTWMWGPVGLLMATPLTASLVVLGKYVPQLRPINVLLGDKIPLPPFISFYQRMLADDIPRSLKILETAIEETGVDVTADDLVLPTLRRVRRDRASEELSAPREHRLMEQITDVIDEVLTSHCTQAAERAKEEAEEAGLAETDGSIPAPHLDTKLGAPTESCPTRVAWAVEDVDTAHYALTDDAVKHCEVVGCTAHHESEEPALKMLSYSLSECGVEMRWAGTRALPTDLEDWIEKVQPKVIVITIVPPGGLTQARFMCERLHERLPGAKIVVAFLGKTQKYDALLVKFRRAGASHFTTSLHQTRVQICNSLSRAAGGLPGAKLEKPVGLR
ncbi:MAG: AI-2E family transporter [Aureliella sp.]